MAAVDSKEVSNYRTKDSNQNKRQKDSNSSYKRNYLIFN